MELPGNISESVVKGTGSPLLREVEKRRCREM
jgi:hypothetical protein